MVLRRYGFAAAFLPAGFYATFPCNECAEQPNHAGVSLPNTGLNLRAPLPSAASTLSPSHSHHLVVPPTRCSLQDVARSTQRGHMKRGEYKAFTFRLPIHLPEVLLRITLESEAGCICLYVSNCSERPKPRLCQWTLLVHAEGERTSALKVRTDETHYVRGLYHVGLYCVTDGTYSLGLFPPPPPDVASLGLGVTAPVGKSPGKAKPAADTSEAGSAALGFGLQTPPATPCAPTKPATSGTPSPRRPLVPSAPPRGDWDDEGVLESTLASRMLLRRPRHELGLSMLGEALLSPRDSEKAAQLGAVSAPDGGLAARALPPGNGIERPPASWRERVAPAPQGQRKGHLDKWIPPGDIHYSRTCGGDAAPAPRPPEHTARRAPSSPSRCSHWPRTCPLHPVYRLASRAARRNQR